MTLYKFENTINYGKEEIFVSEYEVIERNSRNGVIFITASNPNGHKEIVSTACLDKILSVSGRPQFGTMYSFNGSKYNYIQKLIYTEENNQSTLSNEFCKGNQRIRTLLEIAKNYTSNF